MDIQKQFGARVRELRARAGLTQAELADRCGQGVEMQRIGEIERGEQNCTLKTVQRLAKGLRCEPAELFLFRPQQVGRTMSMLDARLVDMWRAADEPTRQKAIRILSELI
ncbi:MAG: helix-turn-helix transcriptional regulator [Planctomycetes bacterium]|nr:helix-turn-helix transcriptional regulator [Planctomycetota bacterium]